MPPPPKPASQRRRRNKTTGRRTLPAEGAKRRAPALGPRKPTWLKTTREYWATLWASPMATTWIDADVPALRRLAELVERVSRGEVTAMVLAEVRQLEDRFGLSPLARRRLEWELEHAAPADEVTAAKAKVDAADKGDGRWLRAVGDE